MILQGEYMREKLIELLEDADHLCYVMDCDDCLYVAERMCVRKLQVDHLIANGVTVQRWIPVTERLPNPYENVIGWTKYRERGVVSHNGKRFVWEDDEGDYAHVTHWMPLPDAPKDGDT